MLKPLRRHPWHRASCFTHNADVGLGSVVLSDLNRDSQPAPLNGHLQLVLDGELYETDSLRRKLRSLGCEIRNQSHGELLLHAYETGGFRFVSELHGSFAAAIWDSRNRRLTLFTDRLGSRPLYYVNRPDCVLFSSSIKSLLSDHNVSRGPDWQGIAQFFTFGHYLGSNTSLEAVRVLPPASSLTYDLDEREVTCQSYWCLQKAAAESADANSHWLDVFDEKFQSAVSRCVQGDASLGLALSGGLDARTILALIDSRQFPIQTLCLGMPGSLDHRSAQQLADLAGCTHHNHVLDDTFLDSFDKHLQHLVELTDGQYLSQGIVLPTLPIYRERGIDVLLRGHGGELMHMDKAYSFSLDNEVLAAREANQIEGWLWRHLQAYMLDGVDRPLFRSVARGRIAQLARQSLRECFDDLAAVESPLQRIWHLFVNQRLRRETALSLVKFRSVAETRIPYMDPDLVTVLLAAPPRLKISDQIQSHILRTHRPDFLKVRNTNTGARVGAGTLSRLWGTLRMKLLAKFGVPGYQPYERLGLWLRRQLAPIVQDVLLNEACLDRGIFEPDTVRAVVEQHLNSRRNHTYLLMALMIFELGQRYLCDEHFEGQHPDPVQAAVLSP
jgi:asparagine synthase (glutamine-hydrolysing)